jgi:hypothetical protein
MLRKNKNPNFIYLLFCENTKKFDMDIFFKIFVVFLRSPCYEMPKKSIKKKVGRYFKNITPKQRRAEQGMPRCPCPNKIKTR